MKMPTLPLLTFILSTALCVHRQPPGPNAVLLSEVKTLTLNPGQQTTGRRSSPQPQLQCTGGAGKQYAHTLGPVQCYNTGFDGRDFQWRCESQMDGRVRFGRLDVSCEGYRDPDDEWILAGSCGLEYELDLVPATPATPVVKKTTTTTTKTTQHSGPRTTVDTTIAPVFIACLVALFIIIGLCYVLGDRSNSSGRVPIERQWQSGAHRRVSPPRVTTPAPVYSTVQQPSVVVVQQPATVVVHREQPYGYASGYMDATLMASLNRPSYPPVSHTHTEEVVVTTTTTSDQSDTASSWWGAFGDSDTGSTTETHKSVGYGGTKRR